LSLISTAGHRTGHDPSFMAQLSIDTRPVVVCRSLGNDGTLDAGPINSYWGR